MKCVSLTQEYYSPDLFKVLISSDSLINFKYPAAKENESEGRVAQSTRRSKTSEPGGSDSMHISELEMSPSLLMK